MPSKGGNRERSYRAVNVTRSQYLSRKRREWDKTQGSTTEHSNDEARVDEIQVAKTLGWPAMASPVSYAEQKKNQMRFRVF